jgi:hypothetical protein
MSDEPIFQSDDTFDDQSDSRNSSTRNQAYACAAEMPKGIIGIDDVLIIAEIVYYGFEIWKSCHESSNPSLSAKSSISNAVEGDGQNYSHEMLRRAGRGVRRAARHQKVSLSDGDRDLLTTHMLNYVSKSSDESICGCYGESPVFALNELGDDKDG